MRIAEEMTGLKLFLSRFKARLIMFRMKYLPYIVWYGQKVDVRLTFKENKLTATNINDAFVQFKSGHIYKIEKMLNEIGVDFDTSISEEGRAWDLDWSLTGPVELIFINKSKRKGISK